MKSLTSDETEIIFSMVEKLTGTHQKGHFRKDILISNVEKRMSDLNLVSLAHYLELVAQDNDELKRFISSLTIHTTSWFRERKHFDKLELHFGNGFRQTHVKVLCVACSTGQEAYSMAFVLEGLRELGLILDYTITACDIDPMVVQNAKKAHYSLHEWNQVLAKYQRLCVKHENELYFSPNQNIMKRCHFQKEDLRGLGKKLPPGQFHLLMCRNVLIYFHPSDIPGIVKIFESLLIEKGILCLGHNEMLEAKSYPQLSKLTNSMYTLVPKSEDGPALFSPDVVLLGASTGGTTALVQLLQNMPKGTPPVIVVQHINESFAGDFSMRLAKSSGLKLWDRSYPAPLLDNTLYMARESTHIVLVKKSGKVLVELSDAPAMNRHRPSVDALFRSAVGLPIRCMALLLTGMGEDGAYGLELLKRDGSYTMAQDEDSSTVFGMPKSAIERGATCAVGNIASLRSKLLESIHLNRAS